MEKLKGQFEKHAEKLRFALVGGANTVLDFALLFLLTSLGLHKIPANYISTGIAFIFSFFVNKSFTFQSKGGSVKKQFILFLVVTISGLWVLQPIIILAVSPLFSSLELSDEAVLFIAKLFATLASLIWNYLLYSRLVFKK